MTNRGAEPDETGLPGAEEDHGRPRLVGEDGARLLAGPAGVKAESLAAHLARLGPLPQADPAALLDEIAEAGLGGRGGGGFPVARKLATARRGRGPALVIVNASESEPASRKDRTLCRLRPHLVLDGAELAALAAGADEVAVYCHWGRDGLDRVFSQALAEREKAGQERAGQERGGQERGGRKEPGADGLRWRVVVGPDRYVAGEASAVASFVAGGPALPRFLTAPLAVGGIGTGPGPGNRPTVVHNAETLAHLGLLARRGPGWWRQAGTPEDPGSRLVTVTGAVPEPGLVLEVVEPATIGAVLDRAGLDRAGLDGAGMAGPPGAVLVGGYAGRWLSGEAAANTAYDAASLRRVGAAPGCGLLAVLPAEVCPLEETARLVTYLAGQSAGQCGPCVFGLADVAESVQSLAAGRAGRRDVKRLHRQLAAVTGRGGCHHPDGVAALVASALDVFALDVDRHSRGRRCAGAGHPPVLAVPGERL